jgi:adenine-specific DNA-methyltransferase
VSSTLAVASDRQKALGAFYTPARLAEHLVGWAVRTPGDRVLDPAFGGLAFLEAARNRLLALGRDVTDLGRQLYGSELDGEAHSRALKERSLSIPAANVLCADFLSLTPAVDLPRVEALVGNPPYIRYQGFNAAGTRGHEAAAQAGVRLTRLSSSWAPFVVHGTAFVASGGRMAQVLPAEILHAQYAAQVLAFLRANFSSVTLVLFEHRIFPGALEEIVLLLAEGRSGDPASGVQVVEYRDLSQLDLADIPRATTDGVPLEGDLEKPLARLLPSEAQNLYRALASSPSAARLGDLAVVDIGAVTGANDFFLVRPGMHTLPEEFLRFTVSKASHVRGARFTPDDRQALITEQKPVLMFAPQKGSDVGRNASVTAYLEAGLRRGVHKRYKCRVRSPWWAVPLPRRPEPDLLLTYCSSAHPRLVLNEVKAANTNTLHGVCIRAGVEPSGLAAAFVNSLTLLSAELVGRSYGGGVLKLEPTEAERLLLPPITASMAAHLPEVDNLLRSDLGAALDRVDALVLGPSGLDLDANEIRVLRLGADKLRARRQARHKKPSIRVR